MHWLHSIRSNHPIAQTWKKRNVKDGIDVSAWRTPCVKRALPESLSNNGGRTRKGWQTDTQESARTRRPSLALPQRRRNERVRHQKMNLLMCLCVSGLSKPTDNVGQHAKNNGGSKLSQFRWLGIGLVFCFYIFIDHLQNSTIRFLNFSSTYKNRGTLFKYQTWNVNNHEKAVPMRWILEWL